ncbi:MAG: putative 2-hydroxyacid dehydrogenase [Chloroflexi bacterium ADurb.Bin360]|nr:MAG: putative 2-hydroxyacid dehydrogenase [Chloroflexi bacterium ADurb.Bin360]
MQKRPRIYVTREIPAAGMQILYEYCEVLLWRDSLPVPRETLLGAVADVEGLLTLLSDPIDATLVAAAPHLRVISQYAVGYDNIDIAAATARGIPVGNTPDVLTTATADFAFALLMAAARRIPEGDANVRQGEWHTWGPQTLLGQDVWGATLGVVGLGRIGQAMVRRGRGFAMRVLFTDPRCKAEGEALGAECVSLETLLAEADFVSLHCPLTPETRGLIGERELRMMKPTAILVNTARGAVVQQEALLRALREGWIAGAALDVTDPEPLTPEHPLVGLPNCLITPHIASASVAARTQMAIVAAENLLAGLRGERLPHCVNPQVYR